MRSPTNRARPADPDQPGSHHRAHVVEGSRASRTIQTRNTSVGASAAAGPATTSPEPHPPRGRAPTPSVRRARPGKGSTPPTRLAGAEGIPPAGRRGPDAPGSSSSGARWSLRHRRRPARVRSCTGTARGAVARLGPARGRSDPAPTLADVPADGAFGYPVLRWLTFRHGITRRPIDRPLTPCMSADVVGCSPRSRCSPQSSVARPIGSVSPPLGVQAGNHHVDENRFEDDGGEAAALIQAARPVRPRRRPGVR